MPGRLFPVSDEFTDEASTDASQPRRGGVDGDDDADEEDEDGASLVARMLMLLHRLRQEHNRTPKQPLR